MPPHHAKVSRAHGRTPAFFARELARPKSWQRKRQGVLWVFGEEAEACGGFSKLWVSYWGPDDKGILLFGGLF